LPGWLIFSAEIVWGKVRWVWQMNRLKNTGWFIDFKFTLALHEREKTKILRRRRKGPTKILLFHMKVDNKWIHGSNQPAFNGEDAEVPFSSDDNQFNLSATWPR
jgi:hypothetical protein